NLKYEIGINYFRLGMIHLDMSKQINIDSVNYYMDLADANLKGLRTYRLFAEMETLMSIYYIGEYMKNRDLTSKLKALNSVKKINYYSNLIGYKQYLLSSYKFMYKIYKISRENDSCLKY